MMSSSTTYQSFTGIVTASALVLVASGVLGVMPETKAFWFLSRSSGLVAYGLLWLSVVAGLLISSRARAIVSPKWALEVHQMTSGTALGFALFHGLILTGDRYIRLSVWEVLVPWVGTYRPLWMAAGQVAALLLAAVLGSSLARRRVGNRLWRLLHYSSFLAYWFALSHALALGSEAKHPAVLGFYAVTGAVVLWLTTARIFIREGERGR